MQYILQNPGTVLKLTLEHIQISLISVAISIVIGVVIGIILTRIKILQGPVLGLAGVLYTIPSLALFAMLIPFWFRLKPTVFALILYSQLAIIRNTVSGIETIDPSIIEVAEGMGMTGWQKLFLVELPGVTGNYGRRAHGYGYGHRCGHNCFVYQCWRAGRSHIFRDADGGSKRYLCRRFALDHTGARCGPNSGSSSEKIGALAGRSTINRFG